MDDRRPAILLESHQYHWRWTHGYVEDVAQAVALAVPDDRAMGKTYNLGEIDTPTMVGRLQLLGELMGWDGEVIALEADRMPAHLRAPYQPQQDLVMGTARIRSELGFAELLTVEEGLRRTIDWERIHPSPLGDPGVAEYAAEDAAIG
jgi:nucleoside-diphosphate-sugar epimerase